MKKIKIKLSAEEAADLLTWNHALTFLAKNSDSVQVTPVPSFKRMIRHLSKVFANRKYRERNRPIEFTFTKRAAKEFYRWHLGLTSVGRKIYKPAAFLKIADTLRRHR